MNKKLKLVSLAIPAGWMINQNHFYMTTFEEAEGGYPFYEDILQMSHKNLRLTLDLGWYPEGDAEGKYKLILLPWEKETKAYQMSKKIIKRGFQDENFVYEIKENIEPLWTSPLCSYEAKTWQEIALKIEEIFAKYTQ